MKKARFTETQILRVLKEVEGGRHVKDVCRENGVSEASYYCKHTCFSSTHFLRFPVSQPSAGTLPTSGYSGIHGAATPSVDYSGSTTKPTGS